MKLVLWSLGLIAAVLAAVHGYFYLVAGTVDPCRAAVTRIIQAEQRRGNDLMAGAGALLSNQLETLIRSEGVAACYRSAITGKAPDVTIKLDREGVHVGGGI